MRRRYHEAFTSHFSVSRMLGLCCRREIKRHEKDVLTLEEDIGIIEKELQRCILHRPALIASLKEAKWNLSRVAIESEASRGRW
jgi:hypothetical protein